MYTHAFQGSGGWYIENCLTTVGGKCPVCAHNNGLWNSGIESDKEVARKQKRKLSYYANIYVVQDKANPQNEGQVFLYKFGKKIFDKIMEAMQPEFEDETPINPFDFWQGANFKLKIKKVAGYWNYDSSEFDRPGALLDDDDALEAIWKKEYSLQELIAADQFKSGDDLQKRLDFVLGNRPAARRTDESLEDESEGRGSFKPDFASRPQETESELPSEFRQKLSELSNSASSDDGEEDDTLSYFQRLADS
jgi:hypothetical protein